MSDELFQLSNGRYITSEDISRKLYYIKDHHPETAYQDDSTGYSWDEAGMADLFSECYQNDTRYCPEAKSWYTYETGKWHKDVGALLVSAKIKEFVRLMALYCGEITDEEKRKQYMAFVGKMGDRRFRDRLMKDAADSMKIAAAQFDTHPYLINCLNGTYDLEHMKFREHRWDDFLTMQTNFEYTLQEVTCPRWEQFIKEVTQNEADKADYLQRALGYSILGTSKEECMFILHGKTTRNGKSTMLDAIQHLLGDYSTVAPVELICRGDRQKNAEAANPVLAKLKGKRMVTMSESDTAGKLDEATIKQYTGGEDITARELYQSAITFKPQFTMWLSCNDLPSVKDNVTKGNPARTDFIKKVRQFCGVFREGLMQDGKVNPVTGIFWQKNYDGMKDQTEMVLTPNNPLGEQKDMKALEQKYLESAYDGSEVAEGTFTEIAESPEGAEGAEGQKD